MTRVLNNLLCTLMIFCLTFAWTAYCLRSVKLAFSLALIVAICSCYLIFVVLKRNEAKQTIKKKQRKILQNFAIYLRFCCDNSALFVPMFCYYNFVSQPLDFDNVIISKGEKILAALCFERESVSPERLQQATVIAKRNGCTKLLVFCNKFDAAVASSISCAIDCKFVDIANTYALFEQAEMLPKVSDFPTKKHRLLPQIAFNKNRFGWYFFGAAFTLVTAMFSLLKVYLLVWSTVLFVLAFYCRFNKKYNTQPTDVDLDKF